MRLLSRIFRRLFRKSRETCEEALDSLAKSFTSFL